MGGREIPNNHEKIENKNNIISNENLSSEQKIEKIKTTIDKSYEKNNINISSKETRNLFSLEVSPYDYYTKKNIIDKNYFLRTQTDGKVLSINNNHIEDYSKSEKKIDEEKKTNIKNVRKDALKEISKIIEKTELTEEEYNKLNSENKKKYTKLEGTEEVKIIKNEFRNKYILQNGKDGVKIIDKEERAKQNQQIMEEFKNLNSNKKIIKTDEYGYYSVEDKGESETLIEKNKEIEKKYKNLSKEEKSILELRKNDEGIYQIILVKDQLEDEKIKKDLIEKGIISSGKYRLQKVKEDSDIIVDGKNSNGNYSLINKDTTVEISAGKNGDESSNVKMSIENGKTTKLNNGANMSVTTNLGYQVNKTYNKDEKLDIQVGENTTRKTNIGTDIEYNDKENNTLVDSSIKYTDSKTENSDGTENRTKVTDANLYANKGFNISDNTKVNLITDGTYTKTVNEQNGEKTTINRTVVSNTGKVEHKVTDNLTLSGKVEEKRVKENQNGNEKIEDTKITTTGVGFSYEGTEKKATFRKNGEIATTKYKKTNTYINGLVTKTTEKDNLTGGKIETKTFITEGGTNYNHDKGPVKDGIYTHGIYKTEKEKTDDGKGNIENTITTASSGIVGYTQKEGKIDISVGVTQGIEENKDSIQETTVTTGKLTKGLGETTILDVEVSKSNMSNENKETGILEKGTEKTTKVGINGDNIAFVHTKNTNELQGNSNVTRTTDMTVRTAKEGEDGIYLNYEQNKSSVNGETTVDNSHIEVGGKLNLNNNDGIYKTTVEGLVSSDKDKITGTNTQNKEIGIKVVRDNQDGLVQTLTGNYSNDNRYGINSKNSTIKKRVEYSGKKTNSNGDTFGVNVLYYKKDTSNVDGNSDKQTTIDFALYGDIGLNNGTRIGGGLQYNEHKNIAGTVEKSSHTYKANIYLKQVSGDKYQITYDKNEGEEGNKQFIGAKYEGHIGDKKSRHNLNASLKIQTEGDPGVINNQFGEKKKKSNIAFNVGYEYKF